MGFWLIVLLCVGAGQRWLLRSSDPAATKPITLDRPLSTLPLRIGSWEGMEIPLDARVEERAAHDDYLNRRYVEAESNRFVDLFLAYTASPETMLGHRPDVCYPAWGWRLVETKQDTLARSDGSTLKCLLQEFTRGAAQYEGLVVLNYYVLRGEYTTEWTDFGGPGRQGRNPSVDPRFYVAQVQIVTPVMLASLFDRGEETVKRFAAQVVDEVEVLLPMTPPATREAGRHVPANRRAAESSRD
ncbi:MAG: exosortase-associated EpsI family protein [Phycisphaerales bacterium]|nr:exosortase-associated EpsI family protein [Phycisphaerales bacterium]